MNSTLIIFILAPQLQSLMADAMDTLEGRRNDKERVWNTIQKVKLSVEGEKDILFSKKIPIWGQICLKIKRKESSSTCFIGGFLFKTNAALSLEV